ncbi:MAG: ATP synthase F1 subunit gamma [Eubacteriales bacterium]|nr:ATP synthase F1 subunit gamma [Eubacteriales bacterium]
MATTKEIKRRIRGINSTRQITKAMELVSTAKLRKARQKLESSRPYYTTVVESIQNVLEYVNLNHPFLLRREVKKTLLVVITSDRGLAGGYNNNITDMASDLIAEDPSAYELVVIGDKARDRLENSGAELIKSYRGFPEVIDFQHAQRVGKVVMERYASKAVDRVLLLFTRFDTTLQYTPMSLEVLPFSAPKADEKAEKKARTLVTFEPNPDEVLDNLIPLYVVITVFGALIEASASEQASRRTAMEAATENADEMIEDLSVSYNRARQAAITNEITEIVSGANALQ